MAFLTGVPTVLPWVTLVNDEAINATICQPAYSDAAGGFKLALGDGSTKAAVIGVVIDPLIRPAANGNVLTTGAVNATTAQWDAVCGTSGGLSFGVTYYLSATVAGALTTSNASGVAVLAGLSATQAKIIIGGGSGGGGASATFPLINASGGTLSAGMPVYGSASGSFAGAVATSLAAATVVGVLTADCANGATGSVQATNVVALTTAQWDARTGGSGGLVFGQQYWLDVTAGKITTTAPIAASQFVTALGVALSATQLRLLVQPPIGL